jgi:hypothetical protein
MRLLYALILRGGDTCLGRRLRSYRQQTRCFEQVRVGYITVGTRKFLATAKSSDDNDGKSGKPFSI